MGKFFECGTILQGHAAMSYMLSALSAHDVVRDDIFWLFIASR